MTKKYRDARFLEHFYRGGDEVPKGMGPGTIFNYVQRNWIVRIESWEDFGPARYRLTPTGIAACHDYLNRED